jgi:uncharacterized protein with von Willebrand factor type A (vWA) domain
MAMPAPPRPRADAYCNAGHHTYVAVYGDRMCTKCLTSELSTLRRQLEQLRAQLALHNAARLAAQRQQRRPR